MSSGVVAQGSARGAPVSVLASPVSARRNGGGARRRRAASASSSTAGGSVGSGVASLGSDATLYKENHAVHKGGTKSLRLSAEASLFAALELIWRKHGKANVTSAVVLVVEFLQFMSLLSVGRTGVWGTGIAVEALVGYFDSSFRGAISAFVLILIFCSIPSLAYMSSYTTTFGAFGRVYMNVVVRWQLLFFLNVAYIWAVVSFVRFPAICYPWQEGAVRDAAGRLLATTFADEGVLCGTPQMILTIAVGFLMAVFLSVACLVLRPTYHDPYPRSGSIVARSHSRVAVAEAAIKLAIGITVVTSATVWQDILAVVTVSIGFNILFYLTYVYMPYYNKWTNLFKVATTAWLSLAGVFYPLMYIFGSTFDSPGAGAIRDIIILVYAFVWTALAYRKQRRARAAGMAIANALTAEGENNVAATASAADVAGGRSLALLGSLEARIPPFGRSADVEMATRSLIKEDRMTEAAAVYAHGLEQFPTSPLLHLQYATFLVTAGAYTEADAVLESLAAMLSESPLLAYDLRFGAYALRKELARRRRVGGVMDVASYVKYNARLVDATRAHTAAMRHVHALWSLVLRSDEEFLRRSHRLAETIGKDASRSEKLFCDLMEDYPNAVPIIRAYATFTEEVYNDEIKADSLRRRADLLEARRDGNDDGGAAANGIVTAYGTGDQLGGERMIPNEATDAVLTVTTQGRIVSANHNVSVFGLDIDHAIGRGVRSLVGLEGTAIEAAIEGGVDDEEEMGGLELVDGLHVDGTIIPLLADVTAVTAGANATYALVLRPVHGTATLRYNSQRTVVAVGVGLRRLLGLRAIEVVGQNIDEVLPGLADAVRTARGGGGGMPARSGAGIDTSSNSSSYSLSDESIVGGTSVNVGNYACTSRSGKELSLHVTSVVEHFNGGGDGGGGFRPVGGIEVVTLVPTSDVCTVRVTRAGEVWEADGSTRAVLFRPRRSVVGSTMRSMVPGLGSAELWRTSTLGGAPRVVSVVADDGTRQLCALSISRMRSYSTLGSTVNGSAPTLAGFGSLTLTTLPGSGGELASSGSPLRPSAVSLAAATAASNGAVSDAGQRPAAYEVVVRVIATKGETAGGAGALLDGGSDRGSITDSQSWVTNVSGGSGNTAAAAGKERRRDETLGGRVRKAHRFKTKSYIYFEWAGLVVAGPTWLALFFFFIYALSVRSDLVQIPLRMGLHAVREHALYAGMATLQSASVAWRLAAVNASTVAGLSFAYSIDDYAQLVTAASDATLVLFNGNDTFASIYDVGGVGIDMPTLAEEWTNGSTVELVLSTGECSSETYARSVTYEVGTNLMINGLIDSLAIRSHEVMECASEDTLPAALYMLNRNGVLGLRDLVGDGLSLETQAGLHSVFQIQATARLMFVVLTLLTLLSAPSMCLAVRRIRMERERAALAFVGIAKTDVAALARSTGRYAKGRRGDDGADRRSIRRKQRKRMRRGSGVRRSAATLAPNKGRVDSRSLSGSSRNASSDGEGPRARNSASNEAHGDDEAGASSAMSSSSASFSSSAGAIVGLSVSSASLAPNPERHVAMNVDPIDIGAPMAAPTKFNRASTPRGGVLKPASRTDYEAPPKPRTVWGETPKASVRTEHYRQSLLTGLAPSMGPAILIVGIFLLATVVGALHLLYTFFLDTQFENYGVAVQRSSGAEVLVWAVRELWLNHAMPPGSYHDIFAEAGVVGSTVVADLMGDFDRAHEHLLAQPPAPEEGLLRAECLVSEGDLAELGLDGIAFGARTGSGAEPSADRQCLTLTLAVQTFLHDAQTINEALAFHGESAEDVREEMARVWVLGTTVLAPALRRSERIYFDVASDFSGGFQAIIFAFQLLMVSSPNILIVRQYTTQLRDGTRQVIDLLRLIPHRVVEASIEVEEYLRAFE